MTGNSAPLWEALVRYRQRQILPMHTPGHKGRAGVLPSVDDVLGHQLFAHDSSDEVDCPEYQHAFERVLAEAEQLAAELFGAAATRFLVNGTSSGIHAMLLGYRGRVLVPRFSHQSVFAALALSDAQVIYHPTTFDHRMRIPLPPHGQELAPYKDVVDAVVVTYPTYYGTAADLGAIRQMFASALLLVDEAHGGHFCFSSDLPPAALHLGADLVAQSTHKTLGSLTQSSMLHIKDGGRLRSVDRNLAILQTTSPSLVLLGVLDETRRVLAMHGRSLVAKAVELGRLAYHELSQMTDVELLPANLRHDPTKVVFHLANLGLRGTEVEWTLRTEFGIQVELSDAYSVLALLGIGDNEENVQRLVQALSVIVRRHRRSSQPLLEQVDLADYPAIPPSVMGLRQALFRKTGQVGLSAARGRIAATFVTPYPPGVPLIVPGEEFTPDIIQYIQWIRSVGWHIRGVDAENISVLED